MTPSRSGINSGLGVPSLLLPHDQQTSKSSSTFSPHLEQIHMANSSKKVAKQLAWLSLFTKGQARLPVLRDDRFRQGVAGLARGGFDGRLPARLSGLEAGGDAARAVDNGARAVRPKPGRAVSGAASLGAVTGDEEEHIGQQAAEPGQLGGMCGANNSADISQAKFSRIFLGPGRHRFTHMLVQGPAGAHQILKQARTWIARSHQDKNAALLLARTGKERLDGIPTQV